MKMSTSETIADLGRAADAVGLLGIAATRDRAVFRLVERRLRRRLAKMACGATWGDLAGQGDKAAQMVVEFERRAVAPVASGC